jgi:tRNA (guanine-N7-)-methyltransferase
MSRKKLVRFSVNQQAENVFEPGKEDYEKMKGNWHRSFFKNNNPIVLELACGKGEYTTGLAKIFPDKNFIGIDIKGDRIWYGSQHAAENNLANVAFLRTHILFLEKFFAPEEVSEIWLVFPDPRPRERDRKRRLTSPRFLNLYKGILRDGGIIHLKTDNEQLFDYTLEVCNSGEFAVSDLTATKDLYQSPLSAEHYGIVTRFESIWTAKGASIKYLRFALGTGASNTEHQELA